MALLGNVGPLGDDLLHLVPDSVSAASAAFAAADTRYHVTHAEVKQAEAAVKAAKQQDRSAARAAELDGTPIPKAKAPGAESALAEAKRQHEAAEGAATTRLREYTATVREAHAQIVTSAKAELGRIAEASVTHVDQLEECLEMGVSARRLLSELGDGDYLAGRAPQFKPSRVGREARRDALNGQPRERLNALRELLEQPA